MIKQWDGTCGVLKCQRSAKTCPSASDRIKVDLFGNRGLLEAQLNNRSFESSIEGFGGTLFLEKVSIPFSTFTFHNYVLDSITPSLCCASTFSFSLFTSNGTLTYPPQITAFKNTKNTITANPSTLFCPILHPIPGFSALTHKPTKKTRTSPPSFTATPSN